MLKKETIEKIASILKIKAADLDAAIKNEQDMDLLINDKLASYTEDEIQQLKNNEYKSGKEKGVEIAVKEAKEKYNLEFSGKTIDGLVEHAKKSALDEAKVKPDQRVDDLEGKVKSLQQTVLDYEQKMSEKEMEVTNVKINGELLKYIPSLGEGSPSLGADDIIQLMKGNGYDFKLENGSIVPYKDGKQLQDHLSNARIAKDVISDFVKEKKLIPEQSSIPSGRGGSDGKPVTQFTKISELKKSYEDQGKSALGVEFRQAVENAVKNNPEFDLNN